MKFLLIYETLRMDWNQTRHYRQRIESNVVAEPPVALRYESIAEYLKEDLNNNPERNRLDFYLSSIGPGNSADYLNIDERERIACERAERIIDITTGLTNIVISDSLDELPQDLEGIVNRRNELLKTLKYRALFEDERWKCESFLKEIDVRIGYILSWYAQSIVDQGYYDEIKRDIRRAETRRSRKRLIQKVTKLSLPLIATAIFASACAPAISSIVPTPTPTATQVFAEGDVNMYGPQVATATPEAVEPSQETEQLRYCTIDDVLSMQSGSTLDGQANAFNLSLNAEKFQREFSQFVEESAIKEGETFHVYFKNFTSGTETGLHMYYFSKTEMSEDELTKAVAGIQDGLTFFRDQQLPGEKSLQPFPGVFILGDISYKTQDGSIIKLLVPLAETRDLRVEGHKTFTASKADPIFKLMLDNSLEQIAKGATVLTNPTVLGTVVGDSFSGFMVVNGKAGSIIDIFLRNSADSCQMTNAMLEQFPFSVIVNEITNWMTNPLITLSGSRMIDVTNLVEFARKLEAKAGVYNEAYYSQKNWTNALYTMNGNEIVLTLAGRNLVNRFMLKTEDRSNNIAVQLAQQNFINNVLVPELSKSTEADFTSLHSWYVFALCEYLSTLAQRAYLIAD